MPSWKELFDLVQKSLSSRPEDAERLIGFIQNIAGDDSLIAYHLTAQNAPESTPVVLDVAAVSAKRIYGFTLQPSGDLSILAMGIRQLTFVNIRGESGLTVTRFISGGDLVLSFADVAERAAGLVDFARTVVKLAWP